MSKEQDEDKKLKFNIIWVIDEDDTETMVASKMLEYYTRVNLIVSETDHAKAIERLKKISDPAQVPDLIIINVKMPSAEGLAFVKEFDKLPELVKEHCVILLLNAYYNFIGNAAAEEALTYPYVGGMLRKPIEKPQLEEVLERYRNRKRAENVNR